MWSDAEGTRAFDWSIGAQTVISSPSRSVATAASQTVIVTEVASGGLTVTSAPIAVNPPLPLLPSMKGTR